MPKISIIIPVYKTEQYLKQCLDSVVSQTLRDIEIIVINDGSPDHSIDIIREYQKKDERIVVVDKKNEGPGKARNDGINRSTGLYICFMDSDDYYPDKEVLEKLFFAAEKYHAKIVGGYALSLKRGRIEKYLPDTFGKLEFKQTEGINDYHSYAYDYEYWKYIYKRELLIDNNIYFPSYLRFQDPPFFIRAMHTAKQYAYIEYPTYVYRIAENEMHITVKKAVDMIEAMVDNLDYAKKNDIAKLYYLTALRLNKDISNVFEYLVVNGDNPEELLPHIIKANEQINFEYLRKNGYEDEKLCLLLVFRFMMESTMKYHALRNSKIGKIARSITSPIRQKKREANRCVH